MADEFNYVSSLKLTGLQGDIRRDNNFVVTIEGVTDTEENLELVIRRAFLPKPSVNPLEIRHGNDAKKYAGVVTWEGGQLSIIDTLSQEELSTVLAWFKKTYNWRKGTIGVASEYKKNGYITEYASDGRYRRKWQIEGMWISNLDFGDLDASSGEMKQVLLTIQIDPSRNFGPSYADDEDTAYNTDGEDIVDSKEAAMDAAAE